MKEKIRYSILFLLAVVLAGCSPYNAPTNTPTDTPTDSLTNHPTDNPTDNTNPSQHRDQEYLYDLAAVPEIRLTFTEEDWNTYLSNYDKNKDNTIYVPAAFSFTKDGQTFVRDSVGVRPRGNTSRHRPEGEYGQKHNAENTDWHHCHFGVKFTEYTSGERFFGSDRVVLKYFNGDPAYCREFFCYDLFRRFGVWSAPRASYCRLYIHVQGDAKPAYFGVYAMIEGVRNGWRDGRYKDGKLPDKTGNLWKAAYNSNGPADLSDFNAGGISKMGVADDEHAYSYALKTNKKNLSAAQQELVDFMEQMRPLPSGSDALKSYLEEHMDVDLFLRYLAVNVAVGMWDDYWVNANNYYFYFDQNHRFYFIPYDYDNTLGTSKPINGMQDSGKQDPLNWGSRGGDRLLVRKVLSIPAFEETYKSYLKTIVTDPEYMEPDAAIARIQTLQSLVKDYVRNDTGTEMTITDQTRRDDGDKEYCLLTGGNDGSAFSNYFRTKAASVYW